MRLVAVEIRSCVSGTVDLVEKELVRFESTKGREGLKGT